MTLSFLVLAILGAGGYLLLAGPETLVVHATWESVGDHIASVPESPTRRELAQLVGTEGAALEASHGHWLGRHRESLRPLWGLLVLRTSAAWTALPILGTALGCGVCLGLIRRERARAQFAYCSVTWNYLGKVLFALSVAGYVITAFAPVGLPVWMLYVFMVTAASGGGLYCAHIPPKF
jgi:hypothetical protein